MKTCINIVVDNVYQKYAPFYVYFVQRSYPEYFVKVFFNGKMSNSYRQAFNLVKTDKVEYLENFFKGYPTHSTQLKKCLRWVIPYSHFDGFDNIYIGDADMLICREDPDLATQHLEHAHNQNIPYSNVVRKGTQRMTGLHFMTRDYLEKTQSSFEIYCKKFKSLKFRNYNQSNPKIGNCSDEPFLYDIIKHAKIGFASDFFRPHHGIHLGIWRNLEKSLSADWYSNPVNPKKSQHASYYSFYLDQEKTKTFQDLYKMIPLPEFNRMKKCFNKL